MPGYRTRLEQSLAKPRPGKEGIVNRGFFGSSISALALLALASAADAHHPPRFDRCKLYTIEGSVQSVQWGNPHVKLSIKAENGTTYDLIWRSIQQLSIAGIQKESVKVGDRLAVKGTKQSDDGDRVSLLLTELHGAPDGVQWSQPPQGC
jgi:hypothetical protein